MNHRKAIHKGQNIEGTILISKITEQPLFVKLRVGGDKGNTRKYQLNNFIKEIL